MATEYRWKSSVPHAVMKHSQDADEAMKAFQSEDAELLILDRATDRRLLREIDYTILPIMCV